ncbi:MAG: hypothetical protein M3N16_03815 [Actinomycetota bacterium]|nr:hypothetical protein [Actinomycetota bacterium]
MPESPTPSQRSRRVARLLLKAVEGLPERERRTVLEHLLETAISRAVAEGGPVLEAFPPGAERLGREQREGIKRRLQEGRVDEVLAALQAEGWPGSSGPTGGKPLATFHPAGPGPVQQMIPVRLSEEQHRRLKEWCAQHNFPMAVVVRGLVERFLDDQERRAA